MNKYGQVAVLAATNLRGSINSDPVQAWKSAADQVFPDSVSSRDKGCPKSAFLGLCEDGLIKGVDGGNYTRSLDNKRYAVNALAALRRNPSLANDHRALWEKVMNGIEKSENSQMDVVIALWREGLVVDS